jgi:hypothetical protein
MRLERMFDVPCTPFPRCTHLLPLCIFACNSEAHPHEVPGAPAGITVRSAVPMPAGTGTSSVPPPPAPKTWMTPAEEQVAITALLVRGREKLIDYVGEGEMEGVGRPHSPSRSLARSTSIALLHLCVSCSMCTKWRVYNQGETYIVAHLGMCPSTSCSHFGGTCIVDADPIVLRCAKRSAVLSTSCMCPVPGQAPVGKAGECQTPTSATSHPGPSTGS